MLVSNLTVTSNRATEKRMKSGKKKNSTSLRPAAGQEFALGLVSECPGDACADDTDGLSVFDCTVRGGLGD